MEALGGAEVGVLLVTGKIEHSTGTTKVLFFKCTPTEEVCLCKCQFGKSKLHF